jgi:outer membrane protein OmpA-like peptidoglycan-associated protein
MNRLWTALLTCVCLSSTAHAQDAIELELIKQVPVGDVPKVIVHPHVDGRLQVSLSCAGKAFSQDVGLSPGRAVTVELAGLPAGQHACEGELTLEASDGSTGSMPLAFQVSLLAELKLSATLDDIDLDAHTLRVTAGRPIGQAMLSVYGAEGVLLAQADADLTDPMHPTFRWTQGAAEVVRLDVEARDQSGFGAKLWLSPWSYAIPHEDVVFASNAHVITGEEAPKLETSWSEVASVMARYGDVVEIRLYVAGYTDTVGEALANQALSERRARAIAAWFRSRGFAGQVFYQGFGERVLAVQTADGVDEASNRRAAYILSADVPQTSDQLPTAAWKPL